MTDPLDTLYASLEAGDAPLSVVADAYEDAGHELAEGVRWLADEGRFPEKAEDDTWDASMYPWRWLLTSMEKWRELHPCYMPFESRPSETTQLQTWVLS